MAAIVKSLYPKNILSGQSIKATITGANFISPVYIILDGNTISSLQLTTTSLKFIIPSLSSGTYSIVVKNGDNTKTVMSSVLTVTDNTTINAMLGSASYPIVLPSTVVNSNTTAVFNTNSSNLQINSTAVVNIDTTDNSLTATKNITKTATAYSASSLTATSGTDANIISPWGTFTNAKRNN